MTCLNFSLILIVCLGITLQTPLDDYVNTPDDNYKYEVIKITQFFDYKLVYINMTSQKWQDGKLNEYFYLMKF